MSLTNFDTADSPATPPSHTCGTKTSTIPRGPAFIEQMLHRDKLNSGELGWALRFVADRGQQPTPHSLRYHALPDGVSGGLCNAARPPGELG